MPAITQKNLDTVAEFITRDLNNGETYTAGQHFGKYWTFVGGSNHKILTAKTKTELYDLMHAFREGVRECKK